MGWRQTLSLCLLPLFSWLFICSAVLNALETFEFIEHAKLLPAQIVGLQKAVLHSRRISNIPLYFPVVAFVDQQQLPHKFISQLPFFNNQINGMTLSVLYRPGQIQQAEVNHFLPLWGKSLLLFCFGCLGLLLDRYLCSRQPLLTL